MLSEFVELMTKMTKRIHGTNHPPPCGDALVVGRRLARRVFGDAPLAVAFAATLLLLGKVLAGRKCAVDSLKQTAEGLFGVCFQLSQALVGLADFGGKCDGSEKHTLRRYWTTVR